MRGNLSNIISSGQLNLKLEYQSLNTARSDTGNATGNYVPVFTRRAKSDQKDASQMVVDMKETEVQNEYFIHRYHSGMKRDMKVVVVGDNDEGEFTLVGWTTLATKRWVRVQLQRVN